MTAPGETDKHDAAPPLNRHHMPVDFTVSLDSYLKRDGVGGGFVEGEQRIPQELGPDQPMAGFEGTYRNIIDYIVRITHRIWEERDVDYIGSTYSPDCDVYDDYGLQHGNTKIISDTHHTTGAFSNIRLIADEIIWAGDEEVGFHTSHRTLIQGTNDGDSKYGPATGKTVDVLVIANCVSRGNVIFLEHVLYNNSSLVQQLGKNVNDVAREMLAAPPAGWPRDSSNWKKLRSATRPPNPIAKASPVSGFDVDAFVRANVENIWNTRNVSALDAYYSKGLRFEGATNRRFTGIADYQRYVKTFQEAFPDLTVHVDEVYWMGNALDGYLSSVRWSASGRHAGHGHWGEPSGIDVEIWGITQHRILGEKIVAEWMLFKELDLQVQIWAARGTK